MTVSVAEQAAVFLCFVVCGGVIGVIFDVIRIFKEIVPVFGKIPAIGDIIFCILAFFALFFCALLFNYGDMRWFSIAGAAIGAAVYFLTVSRLIIGLAYFVIKILKKVFLFIFRVLTFPVAFICKILKKPLIFTFNIGKKGIGRLLCKIKYNIFSFLHFYKHN